MTTSVKIGKLRRAITSSWVVLCNALLLAEKWVSTVLLLLLFLARFELLLEFSRQFIDGSSK